MLRQHLIAATAALAPEVGRWPRREPGMLDIGGVMLKYADLHSFYHQARQIFGERLYDFECPAAAPIILDCGAHVGLASLFFKERYPDARIRAYEADAAIARMCAANLAAAGVDDIKLTTAAVWTHGDGVSFSASADDAGHVAEEGTRIPSVRLRDEIGQGPVELLKLDVEGAEFAILADCGDALHAVNRLIIEVHVFDPARTRVGPLLSLLEAQGFAYTLADLHHANWMPPQTPTPFAVATTDKYYFSVFAWRRD
jgi:FkbM family methyltransferase